MPLLQFKQPNAQIFIYRPLYVSIIEGGKGMRNKLFRKIVVCAILVLFVGIGTMPMAGSLSVEQHALTKNQIEKLNAPPVIEDFTWEVNGNIFQGWTVTFTVICYDETSGMDRVEFAIDDKLMFTDDTPPSPYIWLLENPQHIPGWYSSIIKATAFDKAGNSAFVEMPASGIKSRSYSRPFNQLLSNMLFFQILQRLLKIYI